MDGNHGKNYARSPDVTQEYVVPSQDRHMAGTSLGEIIVLICFNMF